MLVKLRQLECAQGFVHLIRNLLETLGKVMKFILPSGSAVYGNSQRAASGSHTEFSNSNEAVPTSMDFVGSIPHRTDPSSQSSKVSIPVEFVLGVAPRPRFRLFSSSLSFFYCAPFVLKTVG